MTSLLVFAVVVLGAVLLSEYASRFVTRPLAIAIAFVRGGLDWKQWIAVAWFGPKGFASVVYAVLILESGVPDAEHLFTLMAAAIAFSIIAHSSTDVVLADWLKSQQEEHDKLEDSHLQLGDVRRESE
jgi:NhaP-type Na+/H+ or K+/H+ antiporter